MDDKLHHGLSPVSVVGFTTGESSELASPRSSSNAERGSELRSPVSLLSLLLHQQNAMPGAGEEGFDDDEDDEDEDDCYSDCEAYDEVSGPHLPGGPSRGMMPLPNDTSQSCKTCPVDVPSAMWLKEPLAVNELRRMHYERWHRRQLMEREMAREVAERQGKAKAEAEAQLAQQHLQQRAHAQQLYQKHMQLVQQQALAQQQN